MESVTDVDCTAPTHIQGAEMAPTITDRLHKMRLHTKLILLAKWWQVWAVMPIESFTACGFCFGCCECHRGSFRCFRNKIDRYVVETAYNSIGTPLFGGRSTQ